MRKSQFYRHWLPRIVKNVGIDQMKLLMARNQGRCQEIHSRIFQMPTEQSATPKDSKRITPIRNTTRTLAGNHH